MTVSLTGTQSHVPILFLSTIPLPPGTAPIIDFEINVHGEWVLWSNRLGDDVLNLYFNYFIFPLSPSLFLLFLIHVVNCVNLLVYCASFLHFSVPKVEVDTHKVGSSGVIVPTLDTVWHESLLYTWLAEH